MDAVKKQFKEFWAFYRLTSHGGNYKESAKRYFTAMMIVFLSLFVSLIQLQCEFYAFAVVCCVLAFTTGRMTAARATLLSVAPFSPKQRIVFTYLALLVNLLFFVILVNVFYCVIMLIAALIAYCVSGENILVTEYFQQIPDSSVGTGIMLLLSVIALIVTLTVTYIEKNKTRNLVAGLYLAASEFTALALANVCGRAAAEEGNARKFYFSQHLLLTVDEVKNAWIILVVLGVISAALFAVSLWLVIKRNKSSEI